MAMSSKACVKCGEEKPYDSFHRKSTSADGYHSYCKPCKQTPSARRRSELLARGLKKCSSCERELSLDLFYARHATCKECRIRQTEKVRRSNPEHYRALHRCTEASRRARVRDLFVESIDELVVLERDDSACGICGEDIDAFLKWPDPGSMSIDHRQPLAEDGPHAYWNIQAAHLGCNIRKFTA